MTDFLNRRYVVTGAASGIGQAVAQRLLDAGAEVLLSGPQHTVRCGHQPYSRSICPTPQSIDAAWTTWRESDGLSTSPASRHPPADLVLAVNSLAVRHLPEAFLGTAEPGRFGDHRLVDRRLSPGHCDWISSAICSPPTPSKKARHGSRPTRNRATPTTSPKRSARSTPSRWVWLSRRWVSESTPCSQDRLKRRSRRLRRSHGQRHPRRSRTCWAGMRARMSRRVVLFLSSDEAHWVNGQALAVDGGISGAVAGASGVVPAPKSKDTQGEFVTIYALRPTVSASVLADLAGIRYRSAQHCLGVAIGTAARDRAARARNAKSKSPRRWPQTWDGRPVEAWLGDVASTKGEAVSHEST